MGIQKPGVEDYVKLIGIWELASRITQYKKIFILLTSQKSLSVSGQMALPSVLELPFLMWNMHSTKLF